MKCIVLSENTSCSKDLMCEHGLSLWIETGHHTILFDTGQSDVFYHNAQTLGLDMNQVDFCILSHGHYDHGGGLMKFLEVNHHAIIYMHEKAFESHWHGQDKDIGLDQRLKNHPRIHLIRDELHLDETITLSPCIKHQPIKKIQSYGLLVKKDDQWIEEQFDHEIVLLIHEEKRILVSGCTHSGIENVMHWFCPDVLIGGFHLKKMDPIQDRARLLSLALQLKQFNTSYYTGHCTGDEQFAVLKEGLKDQLKSFSTGFCIEV